MFKHHKFQAKRPEIYRVSGVARCPELPALTLLSLCTSMVAYAGKEMQLLILYYAHKTKFSTLS